VIRLSRNISRITTLSVPQTYLNQPDPEETIRKDLQSDQAEQQHETDLLFPRQPKGGEYRQGQ